MMASWMLYAGIVTILAGLAALGLERASRLVGLPGRWAWIAALAGSTGAALVAALVDPRPAPAPLSGAAVVDPAWLLNQIAVRSDAPAWISWDVVLTGAWIAATVVLAGVLAMAYFGVRRDLRTWPEVSVGGSPVRLATDFGPAVLAGVRAVIVIPAWVRELREETQHLVVAHEREHVRAGDAWLLTIGLVLAILMPWNLPFWWQLRRLRIAIELDCDRRLLRAGIDVRAYTDLLLEVARRGVATRLPAPALSNPRSLLARRIDMMTHRTPHAPRTKAALAASVATLLVVLACETPMPAAVGIDDDGNVNAVSAVLSAEEVDVKPHRLSGPVPRYPAMLREAGVEGSVVLDFVIDEDGRVAAEHINVVSSTNRAFEAPAIDVITLSLYSPAEVDGERVAVRAQQQVGFAMQGSGTPGAHIQITGSEPVGRMGSAGTFGSVLRRLEDGDAFARITGEDGAPAPLVYVDGELQGTLGELQPLEDLTPESVERVEVLKGPAAISQYGDRAAGGVIHITRKRQPSGNN